MVNRNLNPEEFDGVMEPGVQAGDPSRPLFRLLDIPHEGDPMDHVRPDLGIHWTHDYGETEYFMADNTVVMNRGVILQADHPGHENIMDWDNPDDAPLMEATIGPRDNEEVVPEVPVRPGSPMRLRGMYDREGNFRPLDERRRA